VLIDFISRRKEFQKLLENAFGILEKEKKMEILSFLHFCPEGLLPLLLISACSAFSLPQPSKPLGLLSSAAASPVLLSLARRVVGRPSRPQPKPATPFSSPSESLPCRARI
jgi:hypothetical protein